MSGFVSFQRGDEEGEHWENPNQMRRPMRENVRKKVLHENPFDEIHAGGHQAINPERPATVVKSPTGKRTKIAIDFFFGRDYNLSVLSLERFWFVARAVNYLYFEGREMTAKRCFLLRVYDLDFEQVALDPKLTHEEKIRLLVQLSHVWTNGKVFLVDDGFRPDVIQAEIPILRPEIERRFAVAA